MRLNGWMRLSVVLSAIWLVGWPIYWIATTPLGRENPSYTLDGVVRGGALLVGAWIIGTLIFFAMKWIYRGFHRLRLENPLENGRHREDDRRMESLSLNLPIAIVVASTILAVAMVVTHRYEIVNVGATSVNPTAWRIDRLTGAVSFCRGLDIPSLNTIYNGLLAECSN